MAPGWRAEWDKSGEHLRRSGAVEAGGAMDARGFEDFNQAHRR